MSQPDDPYQSSVTTEDTRSQPPSQPSICANTESEKQEHNGTESSRSLDNDTQACKELSEKATYFDDECEDGSQEWELVSIPDENENNRDDSNQYFEFHYDLTLGWGRWKHTFLSVDAAHKRSVTYKHEEGCEHEKSSG